MSTSARVSVDDARSASTADPSLELGAGVGLLVAILDDDGRRERQAPLLAGADGHRARAGHDDGAFGNDERLPRLRLDDAAVRQVVDRRRAGDDRARREHGARCG